MASTYLTRTFGTPTNRKIWTWSAWVKRHKLVTDHANAMFGCYYDANNRSVIRFHGHDLNFQDSANSVEIRTNRLFRDVNAWYHIVARVDTTQSTASDRVRLYVNGEQITSFSQADYPNQNVSMEFQGTVVHYINARRASTGTVDSFADMSYSHVHFSDGQSLAPTVFGSTDSTTGEWKINTSPSFTLGNNGFTILKDGMTITDQSTNSNNWTLAAGTLTKTEDNPSNVFATINPLSGYHGDKAILEYGNNQLKSSTGGGAQWYGASTLAFTKGKFYCEVKNITTSNASLAVGISMNPARNQYENHSAGRRGTDIATENYSGNIVIANSNVAVGYMPTWSGSGDICMLAVDADNNKFYIGKNGTWADSDNPSNGTGGYDMSSVANHSESTGFYHFSFGSTSSSYMNSFSVNFGNGYFGTTAVSSAGTNASGIGIFEYDVPTGYTALSTKGLNE